MRRPLQASHLRRALRHPTEAASRLRGRGRPEETRATLDFTVNGSRFQYGLFINAVITFVIIAAVVFFLVVRPYNAFKKRFAREGDKDVPPPEYTVETAGGDALAARLIDRAADGWRVVSVGEAGDGALAAVLVKGEG